VPAAVAEAETSRGVGMCRALYAFYGETESDLAFQEGDVIILLDKDDPSGWWKGELNGKVGFIPTNYVEEIC